MISSTSTPSSKPVTVGVLALQGAFAEHQQVLTKISCPRKLIPILVRTNDDLQRCDGLIIPGGESTTIALLARLAGILEPLQAFVKTKPVWGTCAGAILLSQKAIGLKKGGQELFGSIPVSIARNGWGSQVESFEASLNVTGLRDPSTPFPGVFIRAPVVLSLLPTKPDEPPVQIIARLGPEVVPALSGLELEGLQADATDVVALRQGSHLLTTFHPELTKDNRFHECFIRECLLPSIPA